MYTLSEQIRAILDVSSALFFKSPGPGLKHVAGCQVDALLRFQSQVRNLKTGKVETKTSGSCS